MKPSPELEAHLREFYGALWPHVRDAIQSGMATPVQAAAISRLLTEHVGTDLAGLFTRGFNATEAVSLSVKPQAAIQFLETYKLKLSQSIAETTNQSITAALRGGLDEGDSIPQITKRVEEAWPDITKDKAEVIARTETARAYGEGKLAGWDATGVKRKAWLLSPNPCDLCVAIWQKGPIPIDRPFFALGETLAGVTNDYMDVNAEPGHPACICVAVPVFDDE